MKYKNERVKKIAQRVFTPYIPKPKTDDMYSKKAYPISQDLKIENIELLSKFSKWFKYAVQSPPISCLKPIKKIRKNPKRLYRKNLESFANFRFIRFDKNIVKNEKQYAINF